MHRVETGGWGMWLMEWHQKKAMENRRSEEAAKADMKKKEDR